MKTEDEPELWDEEELEAEDGPGMSLYLRTQSNELINGIEEETVVREIKLECTEISTSACSDASSSTLSLTLGKRKVSGTDFACSSETPDRDSRRKLDPTAGVHTSSRSLSADARKVGPPSLDASEPIIIVIQTLVRLSHHLKSTIYY